MSTFYPLRVAGLTSETRDAVVVTFEVPEQSDEQRALFQFTAGQHLTLRAMLGGEEVRRSYSICSAPHEGTLRIAIKRVQDGLFSTWANHELRPGHVVESMPPSGSFAVAMDPAASRHHVAFAAGSGITPILSILKTVLLEEPQSRFTLVYGNRASSSVLFKEELANLKDRFLDRVNLVFILSREQQEIELFNGRIDGVKTEQLLRYWIDPEAIDVAYLCGPQSMTEEVAAMLETHGVPKSNIRKELFGTSGGLAPRRAAVTAAAGEQECRLTVLQDGRERILTIPRNKLNVLDAALAQGVELPYACKAGVCSTCRCKKIAGEVDMDVNFALEDYEVARGFILTCQSYALSAELVLDFDQES